MDQLKYKTNVQKAGLQPAVNQLVVKPFKKVLDWTSKGRW